MKKHTSEDLDAIYATGGWDGRGSGPGSTVGFTAKFREYLESLIVAESVGSVFDAACGDWQWACRVNWREATYHGMDLCRIVIAQNTKRYSTDRVTFTHGDLATVEWPQADLVLIKDIVHHLDYESVLVLIEKAKRYRLALWVVDLDGDGRVCGAHEHPYFTTLKHVFDFDTRIESYRYGRKAAYLGRLGVEAHTVKPEVTPTDSVAVADPPMPAS